MNIANNIKNFLYDKDYYIVLYEDSLYVYGNIEILYLDNNNIKLQVNDKYFNISGNNLIINKSFDGEMLIKGDIINVKR